MIETEYLVRMEGILAGQPFNSLRVRICPDINDQGFAMKKVLFTDCAFFDKDIQSFKEHNIKIFKVPGDLPEDGLIHQLKRCQGYVIGGADKATKKVIESTNHEIIKYN